MPSGIYSIQSPSGARYIGSAVDLKARNRHHFYLLRKGNHFSRALQRAAVKYGLEALKFSVLLVCRPCDLIFFEQRSIDTLKPEYNSRPIAESQLGFRHTESSKKKIAEAKSGKKLPVSQERCARLMIQIKTMQAANVGRVHSKEEREKRANSLRGIRHKDGFLANLDDRKSADITISYERGEGLVAIAARYRTNHKNIRKILIDAGLSIRSTQFGA